METEGRLVIVDLTAEGQKETFGDDGNILYFVSGGG